MKRLIRIFLIFFSCFVSALVVLELIYFSIIPNSFKKFKEEKIKPSFFGVTFLEVEADVPVVKNFMNLVNNKKFKAMLFGIIPIKQVDVKEFERVYVRPCGTPFGIKFLTDGAMIVDIVSVVSDDGEKIPGEDANLKVGDIITAVDGKAIKENKDLQNAIKRSNGEKVDVEYCRNLKQLHADLIPVYSVVNCEYQAGLMTRDSSAGIGTITFSTDNGIFGGLGHAVFDTDIGEKLPLLEGEIVGVSIEGVTQGTCGTPGELCGSFSEEEPIGDIKINSDSGLYGTLNFNPLFHEKIPIGLKHEAELGKAFIYCTVSEEKSEKYEIEIETIDQTQNLKNFVVEVTDEKLLKETGGIVKGMSGSPIIQNGKLVGAISHVFLNNPRKGYGVFAETMIEASNKVFDNKNDEQRSIGNKTQ